MSFESTTNGIDSTPRSTRKLVIPKSKVLGKGYKRVANPSKKAINVCKNASIQSDNSFKCFFFKNSKPITSSTGSVRLFMKLNATQSKPESNKLSLEQLKQTGDKIESPVLDRKQCLNSDPQKCSPSSQHKKLLLRQTKLNSWTSTKMEKVESIEPKDDGFCSDISQKDTKSENTLNSANSGKCILKSHTLQSINFAGEDVPEKENSLEHHQTSDKSSSGFSKLMNWDESQSSTITLTEPMEESLTANDNALKRTTPVSSFSIEQQRSSRETVYHSEEDSLDELFKKTETIANDINKMDNVPNTSNRAMLNQVQAIIQSLEDKIKITSYENGDRELEYKTTPKLLRKDIVIGQESSDIMYPTNSESSEDEYIRRPLSAPTSMQSSSFSYASSSQQTHQVFCVNQELKEDDQDQGEDLSEGEKIKKVKFLNANHFNSNVNKKHRKFIECYFESFLNLRPFPRHWHVNYEKLFGISTLFTFLFAQIWLLYVLLTDPRK